MNIGKVPESTTFDELHVESDHTYDKGEYTFGTHTYHWRTENISEYYLLNHRNSRQHVERVALVDIL